MLVFACHNTMQFQDAAPCLIRERGMESSVVLHWHTKVWAAPAHPVHISALLRPALNCTRAPPASDPSPLVWNPLSSCGCGSPAHRLWPALGLPLQEQGWWKGNCWGRPSVPNLLASSEYKIVNPPLNKIFLIALTWLLCVWAFRFSS